MRAKRFPLFQKLPVELRLRIWKLAAVKLSPKKMDDIGFIQGETWKGIVGGTTSNYKVQPFVGTNREGWVMSRRTPTTVYVCKTWILQFMYPEGTLDRLLRTTRESRLAVLELWQSRVTKSTYSVVWGTPGYQDLQHQADFHETKAALLKNIGELMEEMKNGFFIMDPAGVYTTDWVHRQWDLKRRIAQSVADLEC